MCAMPKYVEKRHDVGGFFFSPTTLFEHICEKKKKKKEFKINIKKSSNNIIFESDPYFIFCFLKILDEILGGHSKNS